MRKVNLFFLSITVALSMTPIAVNAQQTDRLPALFDSLSSDELKDVEPATESALQEPTVRRSRFVKINSALLAEKVTASEAALDENPVIRLNLFEGQDFSLVKESVNQTSENKTNVVGYSASDSLDRAVFVVENGKITGNVTVGGTLYQIRPVPGTDNVQSISEVNQGGFVDELEPDAPDIENPESQEDQSALDDSDTPPVIDVMVVYTKMAKQASVNIENEIDLAVLETNDSYKQSDVKHRIRLVHTEQVDYPESGNLRQDRNRIKDPSDGFLDSVHTLRNQHKADLVSFWLETSNGGTCGVAYIMKTVSRSFAPFGYSVVKRSCATGYYSFGHELGHILGARHDRHVDNKDGEPHTHNHAFVNPAKKWRTIMGYNTACRVQGIDCTRVKYWSNPKVKLGGDAMGVAVPASNAADNHLTLNKTARTVASFR